ncbi:hypothetical protein BJ165DRAFT_932956 [Panaeolus papilionaceus]|nr:hypothetical protein BJ165DRAFT_932956 [Panaeolus papilionaceus]
MHEDDYDSEPEQEQNDGYGFSNFNDNQGIKMNIVFTPLEKPGSKKRANAKATVISRIDYFHEDFTLRDLLVKVFSGFKQDNILNGSWLYHDRELDKPDTFSMTYTVPRKVTDQAAVLSKADFANLKKEATFKPAAEVKLFFVESQVAGRGAELDEDSEDEGDCTNARKK